MCPVVLGGPRGSAYYEGETTAAGIKAHLLNGRSGSMVKSEAEPEEDEEAEQ